MSSTRRARTPGLWVCNQGGGGGELKDVVELLPCPHVVWGEGSSQRLLDSSWLASTEVMVLPLQKAGDAQESLLTHEARPPPVG